ncbi:MAG: DUF6444 domain-containing protein [Succinivibrionaceae bacterium]
MSQEEIVKQAKSLIQELKSKVTRELYMVINILSIMVETIITLCEKQDKQIANQTKQIESLNASIETLTAEIKELNRQLWLNSNNSSKPPSTDGYNKKNTSLRTKSDKPRGGQKGYLGASLSIPHEPDEVK